MLPAEPQVQSDDVWEQARTLIVINHDQHHRAGAGQATILQQQQTVPDQGSST